MSKDLAAVLHELQETDKPLAVVFVGLPGSGKSTARAVPAISNVAVLSTDDYIDRMAEEAGVSYNEAFGTFISAANQDLKDRTAYYVKHDTSFIWDQTNLTVKKRADILRRIKGSNRDYHVVAVYFEIDEDERQKRMKGREGKTIPPHIDDTMRMSYVRPTTDEGFDEVIAGVSSL